MDAHHRVVRPVRARRPGLRLEHDTARAVETKGDLSGSPLVFFVALHRRPELDRRAEAAGADELSHVRPFRARSRLIVPPLSRSVYLIWAGLTRACDARPENTCLLGQSMDAGTTNDFGAKGRTLTTGFLGQRGSPFHVGPGLPTTAREDRPLPEPAQ